MTPEQIAELILTRVDDHEEAATWVAVVLAESGGDPHAVNLVHHNRHAESFKSADLGLFQINTFWHGVNISVWAMLAPEAAWGYAWRLATDDGTGTSDWTPWIAYTSGAHERHLPVARSAVAAVATTEDPDVTLYPYGYRRELVTLDELMARAHPDKIHPEFARRLRGWLESKGGAIGIGGSWRDDGSQPDRPGFAPEGRSFHQYQQFASGLIKFAAVDLVARNGADVHRAPRWDEVPAQGSDEAAAWGVHCNVGTPGVAGAESWHMQPIEIDGWASFITAGSPDPVDGYELPTDVTEPPLEDDEMEVIRVGGSTGAQYLRHGFTARHIPDGATKQAWADTLGFDPKARDVEDAYLASLTLVGQVPGFA